MTETPETLKRYYRDLTDDQLREEYRYRMNYPTRFLTAEGTALIINTRRAVWELMKERGLLEITESH